MLLPATGILTIQPINNNNNGYVEIKLDDIQLIANYTIILHIIDVKDIKTAIDNIETSIEQMEMLPNKKFLQSELNKAKLKFYTIQVHRTKRGLANIVGTGLKWIAGTMDDEDRSSIENHLQNIDQNNHNLIEGFNQNILINNHFNETIKILKNTIEDDRLKVLDRLNTIDKDNDKTLSQTMYVDTLLKIKILSDQIEHIQNNIMAAKQNMMISNMFTIQEIESLDIDFFKLQFTKLTVANYKENQILFILKVPKETVISKRSYITPIKDKNNLEIDFKAQQIIYYNNSPYQYSEVNDINLLKKSNLCMFNNNLCSKIKNTQEEIIEIEPGLICAKNLNNAKLLSNCDDRNITLLNDHLITFSNCEIQINELTLKNYDRSFKDHFIKTPDIPLNKSITTLTFDEIVLKEFDNIKQIKELKNHKTIHYSFIISNTTIILLLIIVIIIAVICIYKKFSKIKTKIQENFLSREGGVTSIQTPTQTNTITTTSPLQINFQE